MRLCLVAPALALLVACMPQRIPGQDDVPDSVAALDVGADGEADSAEDAVADVEPLPDVVVADAAEDVPVLDVPKPLDLGPADVADTAAPLPTGPCDFVGLLGGGDPVSEAAHTVGAYRVTVDPFALRAWHESEPGQDVVATALSGGMVHARAGALQVSEVGATWAVAFAPGTTCTGARVATVASAHERAVIAGYFDDGGPCLGLTFRVSLCQPRPDELRLLVELVGEGFATATLRLASDPGERILGLGAQAPVTTLNLKGRTIPVLVRPGGIGRGQSPVTELVEAETPGAGGSPDSTPYPVPFFMTSASRGLYLAHDEVSLFTFAPKATEVSARRSPLDVRVLRGPTPLALVQQLTEVTGRATPPPAWVEEGAIIGLSSGTGPALIHLDALLEQGALVSAVWRPDWSGAGRPWSWPMPPDDAKTWATWGATLADRGIRTLCQVDPVLRPVAGGPGGARDLYAEAVEGGLVVTVEGAPAVVTGDDGVDGVLLDATNPAAAAWMKDVLQKLVQGAAGCDGWTAPGGELFPVEAVADGDSDSAHNLYPVAWAHLLSEAVAGQGLVLARAGFTGTPASGAVPWTGEQLTTWDDQDGFASALRALIGGGISGIAYNHMETGGSTSVASLGLVLGREPELLRRWVEASAFTALLRTHEGDSPEDNAQIYSDPESMEHFARFTRVYKALAFYRGQLHEQATSQGWPLVRHLALHTPGDAPSWLVDDEFLLGSEILVAPSVERCLTPPDCPHERKVYLPPGVWTHLWTGKDYGVMASGTKVTVEAPVGRPAVFYRKASPVGLSFVQNLTLLGVEL
ncbi:MAG: hypothetical protein AMXMBFR64_36210 [Myxococcales bacterium]